MSVHRICKLFSQFFSSHQNNFFSQYVRTIMVTEYFLNFSYLFVWNNFFFQIFPAATLQQNNEISNKNNLLGLRENSYKKQFSYFFLQVPKLQYVFHFENYDSSNKLDLRNLLEQVKKAFCFKTWFDLSHKLLQCRQGDYCKITWRSSNRLR